MMLLTTRQILPVVILAMAGYVVPASAGHHGHASMEKCLNAASQVRPGNYIKVEYRPFNSMGIRIYEFEVKDRNGEHWELLCDADRGVIVEIEREVDSPDHELFKPRMKVPESDARKTALAMYPGTVRKVEYEIEFDGEPVYEFEIMAEDGIKWKVEVSAETGRIKTVAIETWQMELGKR